MSEHYSNSQVSRYLSEIDCKSRQLIVWLLQSDQPGSINLATDMARPGSRDPLRSEASPSHHADLKTATAEAVDMALKREARLIAVSWFPREPVIPVGRLCHFDLNRFIASRRRALQRTFLGVPAFGVIDVSLNTLRCGQIFWVPEVRLIIGAAGGRNFRDRFRRHCGTNGNVVQPLRTLALTDANRAEHIKGAINSMPQLRIRTIDSAGRYSTVSELLTGEAAAEAALFLHRYPFQNRLILRGLRRMGSQNRLSLKRFN